MNTSMDTTTLVCLTGRSPTVRSGDIAIILTDNKTLTDVAKGVELTYSYMEDPVITDIENNETPVSGGVTVGIIGRFLTSVSGPELTVTCNIETIIITVKKECKEVFMEKMLCEVPDLNQIINVTKTIPELVGLNFTELSNTLDFETGVKLDGVKDFESLPDALPNNTNTKLRLFPDPDFERLPDIFYANTWLQILTLTIPVKTSSPAVDS
ncbi:unnamed protein product [Owenia fusiformis]|uniref:Uncharacterized protein n=1 Tax=Owenia fusiformis TaxID=6347 RepID=A0A8S4PNC8_OWEFU|nr:unnamed protein product [Owenia fusiformis]